MQIQINGHNKAFIQEAISISDLILFENIHKTEGLAIAVNNAVIPRPDWSNFQLKNNDKVLIIRAAQGG